MSSLKISNLHEVGNLEELKRRLRPVKTPSKAKLLKAIRDENWFEIYKDLIFRIELYTRKKALNYTKQDVNNIVNGMHAHGLDTLVQGMIDKFQTPVQELPTSQQYIQQLQKEVFSFSPGNRVYGSYSGVEYPLTSEEYEQLLNYVYEKFQAGNSDIASIVDDFAYVDGPESIISPEDEDELSGIIDRVRDELENKGLDLSDNILGSVDQDVIAKKVYDEIYPKINEAVEEGTINSLTEVLDYNFDGANYFSLLNPTDYISKYTEDEDEILEILEKIEDLIQKDIDEINGFSDSDED